MSFGRIYLLVSLASAVHYLPMAMKMLPAASASDPSALLRSLQQLQVQAAGSPGGSRSAELQRLLQGSGSSGENTPPELRRLLEAAGSAGENTPPEIQRLLQGGQQQAEQPPAAPGPNQDERQILHDLHEINSAGSVKAPVLDALIKTLRQNQSQTRSLRDRAWEAWLAAQREYIEIRPVLETWLWGVPVALIVLGAAALALGMTGWARLLAELGYFLSRRWLWILSMAVVAIAVFAGANPWPLIPNAVIMPPILWLAGSAFILSRVDMNYPVWNSLLRGCAAPLLSMLFVVIFQQARPLISGL